ncbi:unnamed protein product [Symbiodinium sp. CCMP2592]|nr:unnamed protein product [Symbiodinium sp. CCMP2592]
MRVAGSTRAALRQVLLSRDLADQTDAVLDKAVRLARQEVGRRRPTNLEEERSAFSAALSGLGGLTQPYEIDWEVEDFSSLMWELWSSATQGTQSATRLPCLSEDEEAWQESCAELLEALRASQTWPLAKWRLRAVGICWLLAVLCIAAIKYGTWTGRQRLGLVCGIGMFPLFGELLRRYTFDTTDLQFTQPSKLKMPTVRRILLISFLLEFSGREMDEQVLDFDGFEIPAVPTLQGLPQANFAATILGEACHILVRHSAFWICMLLLLAQCFQWGFFEQLTRLLASVALVSERASVAATVVLDHGAELAFTTSSAVIAFTTGSLDLMRTTWLGVDLLDLRCTSTEWVLMARCWRIGSTLSGHAATRTNRSEVLILWASLVTSVGVALPHIASTASDLEVDGLFWTATGSAYVLPNGNLMFAFRYVEVRFVPQWANALWQALNVDITAQHDQIQRLVTNVSASLPATSHPFASATVVDVSWMHPSMRLWLYAQVFLRAVMLHFRSLLTVLATLRGCGLMVVVLLAGTGGLLFRAPCSFQSVWRSWTVMGPRGFRAVWRSFISACQTLR